MWQTLKNQRRPRPQPAETKEQKPPQRDSRDRGPRGGGRGGRGRRPADVGENAFENGGEEIVRESGVY